MARNRSARTAGGGSARGAAASAAVTGKRAAGKDGGKRVSKRRKRSDPLEEEKEKENQSEQDPAISKGNPVVRFGEDVKEHLGKAERAGAEEKTVEEFLTERTEQIISGYTKHAEELVASLRQEAKKQTGELIELWEGESKRRRGSASGRPAMSAATGTFAGANVGASSAEQASKNGLEGRAGGNGGGDSGAKHSAQGEGADGAAAAVETGLSAAGAGGVNAMDVVVPPSAVPGSLADPFDLVLRVTAGVYQGREFRLKPRYRRAARWIGRSTGRKFKVHGMSLSEDSEVSTTHGRVDCMTVNDGPADIKVNGIFITDMGSTNGTKINGEMIQEAIAVRLRSGDELTIGSNLMTVAVVPSSAAGAAHT